MRRKFKQFSDGVRRHKQEQRAVRTVVTEDGVRIRSTGRIGNLVTVETPKRRGTWANINRSPRAMGHEPFTIHEEIDEEDAGCVVEGEMPYENDQEAEEESVSNQSEESDDDDVDDSVVEDMRKLEESFKGISQKFRLINRIGEGTFSTVYKAEDLQYDSYDNDWDLDREHGEDVTAPPAKKRRVGEFQSSQSEASKRKRRPQYVALKKIYVTSSPMRIQNELELLHDLRGCRSVCPLITAMRHHDQVVAVLPYFRHTDFRVYYRDFSITAMRPYFSSLFAALHAVHRHKILHRDIKPTNFLYDPDRERGVLVDFGLAEREGTDWSPCQCLEHVQSRREKLMNPYGESQPTAARGYPKNDQRPSRRANRAGTRGFRAPEVLLKCTSQTTKIDIWSAGVILLTLLARRFPFFNSADDVDAMIEMTSIFGLERMKKAALLHGSIMDINIPTIGAKGFSLEKIIKWAACQDSEPLSPAQLQAIQFLSGLLELDPKKRLSAREALQHDFFTHPIEEEEPEVQYEVEANGAEVEAEADAEDEVHML